MDEPEVDAAARTQHHSCPSPGSHAAAGDPPQGRGELVDSALLDEITLLSEVITNVALYPGQLDDGEVDDVLGVEGTRTQDSRGAGQP